MVVSMLLLLGVMWLIAHFFGIYSILSILIIIFISLATYGVKRDIFDR